jgi:ribosomal protein L34
VAGCLRSKRKSGAPERMRDAIGREVMRRHARGRY